MKKLLWVNAQHIKTYANDKLADLVKQVWDGSNILTAVENNSQLKLTDIIEFVKPRVDNINALAQECEYFYTPLAASAEDKEKHLTPEALEFLAKFAQELNALPEWTLEAIKAMIKAFCLSNNIKMPQLGMPLRLKLCGTTQTPSFDNIIFLLGREEVIKRLA